MFIYSGFKRGFACSTIGLDFIVVFQCGDIVYSSTSKINVLLNEGLYNEPCAMKQESNFHK